MKMIAVVFPALVLAAVVPAQAQGQINLPTRAPATASAATPAPSTGAAAFPTRIGLFNLRDALAATADGKKGLLDLEDKFASRKTSLQKRQIDLQAKQDQLSRASAAMSEAAKAALAKEIENETKVFKRDVEDLNTDADEEQSKLFQQVWVKMQPVLQQYALQNGLAAVLDVGNEQSPVLWASNTVFITDDIVNLYNQSHPATGQPAAAVKPGATPAAKPPVPPAAKKP
jgi:Skp family chaperone for outer membrane proteins